MPQQLEKATAPEINPENNGHFRETTRTGCSSRLVNFLEIFTVDTIQGRPQAFELEGAQINKTMYNAYFPILEGAQNHFFFKKNTYTLKYFRF